MVTRKLERLLSRVRYGTYAPELLERDLRDALADLADDALPLLDRASTIRLWNDDLLQAYGGAVLRARRSVDFREFRDAVRQIRHCRQLLAGIAALLRAVDAIDGATTSIETLAALATTPQLRRLPAIASLAQIVDAAKLTIIEGRSTEAMHMAEVCGRLAECLLEARTIEPAEHGAFDERVESIEALCGATRPFAPPDEDDPVHDGTLIALRQLLRDGHVTLAARLMAEVEIDLAGRRRFWLQYERERFGSVDDVSATVRERDWDGAVDHYWHLSIAKHASTVEQQRGRATAALKELDAAFAPPPPSVENDPAGE
jgi:hypothetical protein